MDPRPSPELSILVVSYNCSGDLERCLDSIRRHVVGLSYEVLVRDNASADADRVASFSGGGIRVICGNDNPGFGVANNELARLARGKYILCLNPDTILLGDAPTALVRHLEADPGCGTCCPQLVNPDGSPQDCWGDPTGLFWDLVEGHYLQGWYRKRSWCRWKNSGTNPWSVGFVSGACLCMKRELWEKLGGFDPGFFLNHEDVELCDRIRLLGLGVHLLPDLRVVHAEGTSQRSNWANYTFHRQQGKWVYISRRYRGVWRFLAQMVWWESIVLKFAVGMLVLRGPGRTRLRGFLRAIRWNLGNAP